MKISWNWLQEIVPAQIDVEKAAEILTDIGLEVEAVENYESVTGGLEGLIVGEIMSCQKHPDADKLTLTEVNTGTGRNLNIVCGAPNVATGQKVIVAPVGVTIHPVKGEALTIKKAKIRGVESEGMLCAEDEIGLGEGHAGLLILNTAAVAGSAVKDYFKEYLYADKIIEIGLTANHADANSHYGTARELYAALKTREIDSTIVLQSIEGNSLVRPEVKENSLRVVIENTTACLRYSGILIQNISIQESPGWLQNRLKALGMRPINNAVDITNYILLQCGQPLHAFDADKISGNTIIVKTLPDDTIFITLDAKERKLHHDDLMICDAEKGMCIAGVYGGIHSGITEATKNIFIESACFNPAFIRRTEARQNLKTDASARFAKGTDVEMTLTALKNAAALILELCGGSIASDIIDIYPEKVKPFNIFLRYERLERISTMKITKEKIAEILESLNIHITEENNNGLQLQVPSYKNDVTREIDVIEEIMRIRGYSNVAVPAFVKTPYILNPGPDKEKMRLETGKYLSDNNFYELFTNSITRSKYIQRYLPEAEQYMIRLLNSLNAELDCMRQTMLFSALEVIQRNVNRKQNDLKLYEFGKVFSLQDGKFSETEKLAIIITGNVAEEGWHTPQKPFTFFDLKTTVEKLLKHLRLAENKNTKNKEVHTGLIRGVEKFRDTASLVSYGTVHPEICKAFDIKQPVYFAEINWQYIPDHAPAKEAEFSEIPKYPEVRRDLSLVLPREIQYQTVLEIAVKEGKKLLKDVILFDVYEGENLGGKKSYAIGLQFRDDEKTLTDAEVDNILQKLILRYEQELQAIIRK